jgi:predicted amino acid dehydrogenase
MVAAYHGIQTGYVLSNCYHAEQVIGKYKPKEMFSCLAESVILMINGKE